MGRPVILTFLSHYVPGYRAGGPIRTIANMVEQLGDVFDFRIVTSDRDLGDPEAYPDVVADVWTVCGEAQVFYRSPGAAGWRALLCSPEARAADLIYLNSFFSTEASLRPLLYRRLGRIARAPVLLAPRGEFSRGALALKPAKKRTFINLSRLLRLHSGVTFQASSDHEAADIRRTLGSVQIATAMDLSGRSKGDVSPPARRSDDPLQVVFLSRISPKKNLLAALDILARVKAAAVNFDIYGVIEDEAYWALCEAAIAELPPNIRARYKGEVEPDAVESVLGAYDAFLFPTLGENYGHVIREALSAGLPVLISDQTPWRGLAAKGAGVDLPLHAPEAFAHWITTLAQTPDEERETMRAAARALGDDPIVADANRSANRDMLLAAVNKTA